MCVFSIAISDTVGEWWPASWTVSSTVPASRSPSSSGNGCSCTAEFHAAAAASYRNTCARAAHSTSVPGRASTRSASWFAIVPDGTYSAASFPRSSAARSWKRLIVGSSP